MSLNIRPLTKTVTAARGMRHDTTALYRPRSRWHWQPSSNEWAATVREGRVSIRPGDPRATVEHDGEEMLFITRLERARGRIARITGKQLVIAYLPSGKVALVER